jgi:hypothetical protein
MQNVITMTTEQAAIVGYLAMAAYCARQAELLTEGLTAPPAKPTHKTETTTSRSGRKFSAEGLKAIRAGAKNSWAKLTPRQRTIRINKMRAGRRVKRAV